MELTLYQFRHAIHLIGCDHDPLCRGYRWHIPDEVILAKLVAWTLQGHYRHAELVLKTLPLSDVRPHRTFQQQAIRRLTLPPGTKNTAPRWHRDGLVFQHIAWLAAIIEGKKKIAASMPHSLPAHKGFDALLVPLNNNNEAIEGLIVCEEKATDNPRNQITQEVWPSIESVEAGERDAELNGELTAILSRYGVKNLDQIITEAHWLNHKAYRVSITVGPEDDPEVKRRALFLGYDVSVPGDLTRRRAETLMVPQLRDWMDVFCERVISAVLTN